MNSRARFLSNVRWRFPTLARGAAFATIAAILSPSALADAPKKMHECLVGHARIRLADIYPEAPEALRSLDLGPSPLPGSSRLVTRAEMVTMMPPGATLPPSVDTVRVVRKTTSIGVAALEKLATDALGQITIPKGGQLLAARPGSSVTVPDGWDSVEAVLPRIPRKSGKTTVSATLRFREGAATVMTADVPIDLMLPDSASIPDVKRGSKALLVIRRGSVEVRAVVSVGADVDVGDEVAATVKDSGRVLRGRLTQATPATLEEIP